MKTVHLLHCCCCLLLTACSCEPLLGLTANGSPVVHYPNALHNVGSNTSARSTEIPHRHRSLLFTLFFFPPPVSRHKSEPNSCRPHTHIHISYLWMLSHCAGINITQCYIISWSNHGASNVQVDSQRADGNDGAVTKQCSVGFYEQLFVLKCGETSSVRTGSG